MNTAIQQFARGRLSANHNNNCFAIYVTLQLQLLLVIGNNILKHLDNTVTGFTEQLSNVCHVTVM